jgi:FtsP/CotA-like multicopper oxidase with cupredoxin domain
MRKVKKIIFIFLGLVALLIVIAGIVIYYMLNKPMTFLNESLTFQNKLVIPPLLEPEIENDEKVFDLKIQAGETEILPGKKATTWGYNGTLLGPTIRARTGDKVRMNIKNTLNEATTVHWHGMHLPAKMDGGPHQTIDPNATWEPNWTISNEAATLWYHPHTMGKTGKQVYQGLAGLFIIDDENAENLNLPKEYGVDDIPVIVQDRKFYADGQLFYDHKHEANELTAGMLGDTILVNGVYAPYVEIPATQVRLRILNASNARRYNFGFSDNRNFYQITSDGGFLDKPVKTNRIMLSSGERAEIVVDLSDVKSSVSLLSYEVVDDINAIQKVVYDLLVSSNDKYQKFKILEMRPKSGNYSKTELPDTLNKINRLTEADATKTRSFTLETSTINNKDMDHKRVDAIVRKDETEIWTVRNQSPMYHPFHIHGVQFQVLGRTYEKKDVQLQAFEHGWKDTVMIAPSQTVRLIIKFTDFADPNLPYMFHCHILEHEDMGMMGQFVVVDKNTREEDVTIKSSLKDNNQDHTTH